jgi:UDP-glucose 4-epimerase
MTTDTILVTGGAGFVGANLVRQILATGSRARVLDDFSTGRWENLAGLEPDVEVLEGDVRDLRTLRQVGSGMRALVHLAALPGTLDGQDEARTLDVNVKGTLCALMVARELRIPFVFASSAAVYGRDNYLVHEKMPPEPRTPVGAHKLTGEIYCRLFYESHGTPTIVLRIFNTFGPHEDGRSPYASVVARFAHKLVSGGTPTIFGDGSQTRDLVYVSNVCDAILRAVRSVDAAGGVFNIGSGDGVAINLLYNQMAELAGVRRAPSRGPARPTDLRHVRAALGHAMRELRYAPTVRLREGLERTIAWHRGHKQEERAHEWFAPSVAEPLRRGFELQPARDCDPEPDEEIPIYDLEEIPA